MKRILTWLFTVYLGSSNLFLMELMFKWENMLFFEYLGRSKLRVYVKFVSFKALGLMHIQSKFSSLLKKLSSNHPKLTRDFLKLSANIDVPSLHKCSFPLFKQHASILLLSTTSKPSLKQYFQSMSLTANISSDLSTSSRPIIEEKPNLIFFHCPFPRRWQQLSEFYSWCLSY